MADTPSWVTIEGTSPRVRWGAFATFLTTILSWAYIKGFLGFLEGALSGISSTLQGLGDFGHTFTFELVTVGVPGLDAAFRANAQWLATLPGGLSLIVATLEVAFVLVVVVGITMLAIRTLLGWLT